MNIGFRLKTGRDDVFIKWLEGVGEDDNAGRAEVSTRKSSDTDQKKFAEPEVNLNNWLDTV